MEDYFIGTGKLKQINVAMSTPRDFTQMNKKKDAALYGLGAGVAAYWLLSGLSTGAQIAATVVVAGGVYFYAKGKKDTTFALGTKDWVDANVGFDERLFSSLSKNDYANLRFGGSARR